MLFLVLVVISGVVTTGRYNYYNPLKKDQSGNLWDSLMNKTKSHSDLALCDLIKRTNRHEPKIVQLTCQQIKHYLEIQPANDDLDSVILYIEGDAIVPQNERLPEEHECQGDVDCRLKDRPRCINFQCQCNRDDQCGLLQNGVCRNGECVTKKVEILCRFHHECVSLDEEMICVETEEGGFKCVAKEKYKYPKCTPKKRSKREAPANSTDKKEPTKLPNKNDGSNSTSTVANKKEPPPNTTTVANKEEPPPTKKAASPTKTPAAVKDKQDKTMRPAPTIMNKQDAPPEDADGTTPAGGEGSGEGSGGDDGFYAPKIDCGEKKPFYVQSSVCVENVCVTNRCRYDKDCSDVNGLVGHCLNHNHDWKNYGISEYDKKYNLIGTCDYRVKKGEKEAKDEKKEEEKEGEKEEKEA